MRIKEYLQEYIIPVLLQFVLLFAFIFMHKSFVSQGKFIMERITVGDETSAPTTGRLVYMILAFALFFVTSALANRVSQSDEKKNVIISFWLGIVSGFFLWQALGEDSWNFGVHTEEGIINFCQLESISVALMLLVFIYFLIYLIRIHALSFGISMVITSFLCNWLGHYIMLGTYPFVYIFFEEGDWIRLVGTIAGLLLLAGSIVYVVKKANNIKSRLFCSSMTYIAIGIISMAYLEG